MTSLAPPDSLLDALLEAIPAALFLVDPELRIVKANEAARQMLAGEGELVLRRPSGELLRCVQTVEGPGGCGASKVCADCVIRKSLLGAFDGLKIVRSRSRMELVRNGTVTACHMLVTTAPFTFSDRQYVLLTLEDISEIVGLRTLIPICAQCKRIRSDTNYWEGLEKYLRTHHDLDFSHGICPACIELLYPEYAPKK
jgi:PAS domain-containing protein